MKKLLLLFVLALAAVACSMQVSEEPTAEIRLAAGNACVIVPHTDGAYPIPYGPPGRRVEARIMNIGTSTCSYEFEADMWKNGVKTSGAKQGPFTLAPATNLSNPSPTNLLRQDFPGIVPVCYYEIWFKYRDNPGDPNTWHSMGLSPC